MLTINPAALTDPPRAEAHNVEAISPDAARAFLKAIEGDRLEALFSVALALGLRRGEALGLRWSDIDFDQQTLRVTNSVERIKGELRLSEPKTRQSRRVLHIPDPLIRKLKEHRARQLEHKMSLGPKWVENNLVFPSSIGTLLEPRNLNRHFESLLVKAKLPTFDCTT